MVVQYHFDARVCNRLYLLLRPKRRAWNGVQVWNDDAQKHRYMGQKYGLRHESVALRDRQMPHEVYESALLAVS